jgi:glycosyltransferase involved in cell wall biosynthesis
MRHDHNTKSLYLGTIPLTAAIQETLSMRILTFCDADGSDIAQRLGTPEYSYHFVLEAFHVALTRIGDVQRIYSPESEADAVWQECLEHGEDCILLSFTPPHKTTLGLLCPTIPVFAWEYPNLPIGSDEESWHADPRNDWCNVLLKTRAAITLSSHTVQAVKSSLGRDYPIEAIPTPLWGKFEQERTRGLLSPQRTGVEISLKTRLVDSYLLGLSAEGLITTHPDDGTPSEGETDGLLPTMSTDADMGWPSSADPIKSDECPPERPVAITGAPPVCAGWEVPPFYDVHTTLSGVVYTAVLTPSDGRKNWEDLITAFGWAFRDVADATLVLKLGGPKQDRHHLQMLMLLTKLSPMKCRIIALHGYLDEADYSQLIGASTYYVNASLCEGLCMPLMEFLCCGVPAIAPDHTSMADYVDPDFAFVVDSTPGLPALWPHGDHQVDRTSRHQINWHSLMRAYRQSYIVAKTEPGTYAAMSANALSRMRDYCATDNIAAQLNVFLSARFEDVFRNVAHPVRTSASS